MSYRDQRIEGFYILQLLHREWNLWCSIPDSETSEPFLWTWPYSCLRIIGKCGEGSDIARLQVIRAVAGYA